MPGQLASLGVGAFSGTQIAAEKLADETVFVFSEDSSGKIQVVSKGPDHN